MDRNEAKVSQAFIFSHFLKAPFWAMYGLLIFILSKDLQATSFQITCLIAFRPIASLLSPYWSALVYKRPDRLRSNVILASILSHIPFFFFPFIDNPWFFIAASSIHLMLKRGIIPSWMEILKRNLPETNRPKTFSYGSALSYLGGAILPIFFGKWMDIDPHAWRLLFPLTASLSLLAILFLIRLPIDQAPLYKEPFDLKTTLLRPWKNTLGLLKTRKDFLHYQIGFMLGGGGLMLMQPALPPFFLQDLNLSYTVLAVALSTCKGIGFALTSRVWAGWVNRFNIYKISACVTFLTAIFATGLLLAKTQIGFIYVAYFLYGVMQAGSELVWHLSGPIFAKQEDSSAYSSVNVATVGLRGMFVPFCGALLSEAIHPTCAIIVGGAFCLLASLQLQLSSRKYTQAFAK